MSAVLDTMIMFAPWAIGMGNAGLGAYYTNNMSTSDVDEARGTIVHEPGHALLGTGAASIAVQGLAVLGWLKYVMKSKEGKIRVAGVSSEQSRAMKTFWWMLMLFYLLAVVLGALCIHWVTDHGNVDVSVDTTSGQVGGTFGDGVESVSYATLAVGALTLATYMYAEFFTPKSTAASHPDHKKHKSNSKQKHESETPPVQIEVTDL